MQQFVDRTTDDKQIKYVIRKYIKFTPLVFLVVGVHRELGGGGVVENQCVGRHVDSAYVVGHKQPRFGHFQKKRTFNT